ncbi:MAG TPA: hypothetical protein VI755_04460 [Anaerolineales bacterium]|nr:hypothetical protein [Anaerolineales bacterium]
MSGNLFPQLTNSLVEGNPAETVALTQAALEAGLEPMAIMKSCAWQTMN